MPVRDMQSTQPLSDLWSGIGGFLPDLAAGLVVITIGLIIAWIAKRFVVRLLIWLRLDRLAGRVGWRAAFSKGDVRATLYNLAGNIVAVVVMLVFVDDTLHRWGLFAASQIIDGVVSYLPNLGAVALILLLGTAVSNTMGTRVSEALEAEGLQHARLFGKIVKGSLLAVVAALALWQLHLARQIVLAAFLISFGSIGLAFAIAVGLGARHAIEQGFTQIFRVPDDRDDS
jgi:hypothetical protein